MKKSGKDAKVLVELGFTNYSMSALSSVSSPSDVVNKRFVTSATFMSPVTDPVVRLDGVRTGCKVSVSTTVNAIEVAAGTYYLKGSSYSLAATTVTSISRPTSSGNVIVTALSVDSSGTVNKTAGSEGTPSSTRGAAGGPPYIPVDQVLIGYVNAEYTSVSGGAVFGTSEIDDESKEYYDIPGYQFKWYEPDYEKKGCIEFYTALETIHNNSADGTGDDVTRNVYASYHDANFEEIPDARDASLSEDMSTIAGRSYGDSYAEKSLDVPEWGGSVDVFWSDVDDIFDKIKNTKRWVKVYPDRDNDRYYAGVAIMKISRTVPVSDNMGGTLTFEGSGQLHEIV